MAISGNTVFAGVPSNQAIYLFERPPEGWRGKLTQAAKIVEHPVTGSQPLDAASATTGEFGGAVRVFVRPTSGWISAVARSVTLTTPGASRSFLGSH